MKRIIALIFLAGVVACEDPDVQIGPVSDEAQLVEVVDEEATNELFLVVEKMPQFPGGQDAYKKYLLTNLKYPEKAQEMGIEGRVFVQFVVDKQGKLKDFELRKGIGYGCDEEALRMLVESPDWTPGEQRGKAVDTKVNLAITFKLSQPGNVSTIEVPEEIEIPVIVESKNSND